MTNKLLMMKEKHHRLLFPPVLEVGADLEAGAVGLCCEG